jgi:hypothetical protein
MGRTGDPEIEALCQLASHTAGSRGHDMDGWEWLHEEEGVAATATCRRCGRTVHIRAAGGLKGAAGRALVEDCGRPNGT